MAYNTEFAVNTGCCKNGWNKLEFDCKQNGFAAFFLRQYQMYVKSSFAFINAGNIQRPTLNAVEYSFNQGQANEISDMQLFS